MKDCMQWSSVYGCNYKAHFMYVCHGLRLTSVEKQRDRQRTRTYPVSYHFPQHPRPSFPPSAKKEKMFKNDMTTVQKRYSR